MLLGELPRAIGASTLRTDGMLDPALLDDLLPLNDRTANGLPEKEPEDFGPDMDFGVIGATGTLERVEILGEKLRTAGAGDGLPFIREDDTAPPEMLPRDELETLPRDELETLPRDELEMLPRDELEMLPREELEPLPRDEPPRDAAQGSWTNIPRASSIATEAPRTFRFIVCISIPPTD